MQLPGRLRATTLGDLLGSLHRAASSGTLELVDDRGRVHRVYLARGLVVAVELEGASASLAEILRSDRAADDDVLRRSLLRAIASRRLHGQVLIEDFHVSPVIVERALRRQVVARLAEIERLADARVSFRVALRPPRSALQGEALPVGEFLHGRRRARERAASGYAHSMPVHSESNAWGILGLTVGADIAEIKRAYRRLARTLHPDLHPRATDDERRVLQNRFAQATDAYRALVA